MFGRSREKIYGVRPPYLHQPAPVAQRIERRRPKARRRGFESLTANIPPELLMS